MEHERYREMVTNISNKDNTINELNSKIAKLTNEYNETQHTVDNLSDRFLVYKDIADQKIEMSKIHKQTIDNLKESTQKLANEIKRLNQQIKLKNIKIDSLRNQTAEYQKQLLELKDEKEQQLETIQETEDKVTEEPGPSKQHLRSLLQESMEHIVNLKNVIAEKDAQLRFLTGNDNLQGFNSPQSMVSPNDAVNKSKTPHENDENHNNSNNNNSKKKEQELQDNSQMEMSNKTQSHKKQVTQSKKTKKDSVVSSFMGGVKKRSLMIQV